MCEKLDIKINYLESVDLNDYLSSFQYIVDSLFGFSFKGPIRENYIPLFTKLKEH